MEKLRIFRLHWKEISCYNDKNNKEVSAVTFQELAHARYSVRSFKSDPIEEEKLNKKKILALACIIGGILIYSLFG